MNFSRRRAIAVVAAPLLVRMTPARATPAAMQLAIDAFTGGAPVSDGRVTIKIPLLVENGNSVPLSVQVDSPMTETDYVSEVAIFNEVNPLPDTVRFQFSPASGVAMAETRIRLNGSQNVHAIARMNDGTFWSAVSDVIVTAPACREA